MAGGFLSPPSPLLSPPHLDFFNTVVKTLSFVLALLQESGDTNFMIGC